MDPAESIKIYKNKDCAVCDDGREDVEDGEDVEEGEEGGNISSFSCYNPYFSHKSSRIGKTFVKPYTLFYIQKVNKTEKFHSTWSLIFFGGETNVSAPVEKDSLSISAADIREGLQCQQFLVAEHLNQLMEAVTSLG